MAITPSGVVVTSERLRAAVQDPSYFFHKTLAIAEATGSRYVPPGAADAALLEFKTSDLVAQLRRRDIDLHVASALGVTSLPFLVGADVATIVAIRQDQEAFADWRAELRAVARTIGALPSEGDAFRQEAQDVLSDALLPKANALRHAVSRSSVMKSAAGDEVLRLGIGAASLAGAGLITGTPLDVAGLTALGIDDVSAPGVLHLQPIPHASAASIVSLRYPVAEGEPRHKLVRQQPPPHR
jgi:hypothetical protein